MALGLAPTVSVVIDIPPQTVSTHSTRGIQTSEHLSMTFYIECPIETEASLDFPRGVWNTPITARPLALWSAVDTMSHHSGLSE